MLRRVTRTTIRLRRAILRRATTVPGNWMKIHVRVMAELVLDVNSLELEVSRMRTLLLGAGALEEIAALQNPADWEKVARLARRMRDGAVMSHHSQ